MITGHIEFMWRQYRYLYVHSLLDGRKMLKKGERGGKVLPHRLGQHLRRQLFASFAHKHAKIFLHTQR